MASAHEHNVWCKHISPDFDFYLNLLLFYFLSVIHENQHISHDLLDLLEKLQTSRLDDQRCVLPAYFTQVSDT